jgi:hypothetical protein
MLATSHGWRLVVNQLLVGAAAAAVFAATAGVLHRVWTREAVTRVSASPMLTR